MSVLETRNGEVLAPYVRTEFVIKALGDVGISQEHIGRALKKIVELQSEDDSYISPPAVRIDFDDSGEDDYKHEYDDAEADAELADLYGDD